MNLFAYGTLMWPEVIYDLLGRSIPMENALLKGYKRCRIKRVAYPGLKKDDSSEVRGKLLRDLTPTDLKRLDRFEGVEYERILVDVQTEKGQERAFVYIIKPEYVDILEEAPWDEEMGRAFLKRYFNLPD